MDRIWSGIWQRCEWLHSLHVTTLDGLVLLNFAAVVWILGNFVLQHLDRSKLLVY